MLGTSLSARTSISSKCRRIATTRIIVESCGVMIGSEKRTHFAPKIIFENAEGLGLSASTVDGVRSQLSEWNFCKYPRC